MKRGEGKLFQTRSQAVAKTADNTANRADYLVILAIVAK